MNTINQSPESIGNSPKDSKLYFVFGLVLCFLGFVNLFSHFVSAILLILTGLLFIPHFNKKIKEKYNCTLSKKLKKGLVIGLLLLSVIFWHTKEEEKPIANIVTPPSTTATTVETKPTPKTSQQILEENLSKIASKKFGVTDTSYKGLEIEKADPDRPKDTKMLTVKINVSSFYTKDSFLRNTSEQSSEIFQALYASDLNASDAFVWYYGQTKDRYGNQEDSVILSYSMDKATYSKINWQSFEKNKLCNFLITEEKISGFATGPACNTLVNIK